MTKLPISVCIIARNEAARIRRTLESVSGWVSEIIVVLNDDTNDGTDKIAESTGARVFREPWKGFVAQKNSAADKAAFDWLLGLDADEVVPPALRDEIAATVRRPETKPVYSAYNFPRCTFYCGRWIRHGDWYPDRQTRLWRKGLARWSGGTVHEKLAVQGPVGRLQSDLQHFSNDSINRQIQKLVPFSDEFVRQRLADGREAGWLDLAVRPGWRFFRAYVLKFGFLDGWPGYYIARLNAFSALTRYIKVREAKLPK
jgi:glycosyltransferase involved in cell wall biosynthesis